MTRKNYDKWLPFKGYALVKRGPGDITFPAAVETGDVLFVRVPHGTPIPYGWTLEQSSTSGDDWRRIAEGADAGRTIQL